MSITVKYIDNDNEVQKIKELGFEIVPLSDDDKYNSDINKFSSDEVELYNKFRKKYEGQTESKIAKELLERYSTFNFEEEYYDRIGEHIMMADGYEYILLPTGTIFYKGVKYFYEDMIKNKHFWCASKKTACEYAKPYFGSICVYRVENPVKLFILNDNNLNKLCDNHPSIKNIVVGLYGLNLEFNEYKSMICEYKPAWCNSLWFCNEHRVSRDNFIKTKYPASINNCWEFHDALYDLMPLQGTILPYHISCFNQDHSEEINLNTFNNKIEMIKDTPLFWKNWNIDLPPINKFMLNERYPRNYNFKVFDWYNKPHHNNITYGYDKIDIPEKNNYRILSYNIRELTSANALHSSDELLNALNSIIEKVDPDILFLMEVPYSLVTKIGRGYHRVYTPNGSNYQKGMQLLVVTKKQIYSRIIEYKYKAKFRNSILLDFESTKIICTHLEIGERYESLRCFAPISEFTEKYKINYEARMGQLGLLVKASPDIIVGDFNFSIDDKEITNLKNYKYNDQGITSIHGTKVDFAFYGDRITGREYILEYYESDHKPLIFDFYVKKSKTYTGGTKECRSQNYTAVLFSIIVSIILMIIIIGYLDLQIMAPLHNREEPHGIY